MTLPQSEPWSRFLSPEEEKALFDQQQAEQMDRHAETLAVLALSRRARGLHITPEMEQAIEDTSPAKGVPNAWSW